MENRGCQSSGSRSTGTRWRHDPGAFTPLDPQVLLSMNSVHGQRRFSSGRFSHVQSPMEGTHPWGPPPPPEPSPLLVSILAHAK